MSSTSTVTCRGSSPSSPSSRTSSPKPSTKRSTSCTGRTTSRCPPVPGTGWTTIASGASWNGSSTTGRRRSAPTRPHPCDGRREKPVVADDDPCDTGPGARSRSAPHPGGGRATDGPAARLDRRTSVGSVAGDDDDRAGNSALLPAPSPPEAVQHGTGPGNTPKLVRFPARHLGRSGYGSDHDPDVGQHDLTLLPATRVTEAEGRGR